ncbi:M15 family metallopeptidase [Kribbella sp. NBC_01484]|uniref:M15 family metallopeptidase n=1 Tax=Kribbella sp. NBC_01484 TaxID=2903579 RepID=UPI002E2ECEA6|nr:M15 family metallopeptidase [Kribbella sp. NBC_01484]
MPKRRRSGNIGPAGLVAMLTDQLVATRKREYRLTVLTALAIVAAVTCLTLSSCTAVSAQGDPAPSTADAPAGIPSTATRGARSGPPGAADGVLPDHTSAFDTSLPGVANLAPALRKAVQQAEQTMKEDGITMQVTTGWRSKKYQQELLDKAVRKYRSKKKALEFVSTPDESHHVTGHAVDIGPTAADDWLIRKGNRFGLCQTQSNERWHFELVTTPDGTCPPMTRTAS